MSRRRGSQELEPWVNGKTMVVVKKPDKLEQLEWVPFTKDIDGEAIWLKAFFSIAVRGSDELGNNLPEPNKDALPKEKSSADATQEIPGILPELLEAIPFYVELNEDIDSDFKELMKDYFIRVGVDEEFIEDRIVDKSRSFPYKFLKKKGKSIGMNVQNVEKEQQQHDLREIPSNFTFLTLYLVEVPEFSKDETSYVRKWVTESEAEDRSLSGKGFFVVLPQSLSMNELLKEKELDGDDPNVIKPIVPFFVELVEHPHMDGKEKEFHREMIERQGKDFGLKTKVVFRESVSLGEYDADYIKSARGAQ